MDAEEFYYRDKWKDTLYVIRSKVGMHFFHVRQSQIRKFLSSFRYRNTANFLCVQIRNCFTNPQIAEPVHLSQIRKFFTIRHSGWNISFKKFDRFMAKPPKLWPRFLFELQHFEPISIKIENMVFAEVLSMQKIGSRIAQFANRKKWLGLQVANPQIGAFAEGPLILEMKWKERGHQTGKLLPHTVFFER